MFGVEVPANFTPAPVSYQDLRAALQRFQEKLVQAEADPRVAREPGWNPGW